MRFENRVVLVTGGASGIGLKASELFISEGATVVAVDLNQEKLDAAAASLGKAYCATRCDITSVDNIQQLLVDVEKTHGRLDTLVNNAAWAEFKNPEEVEEASYDAQMADQSPAISGEACRQALASGAKWFRGEYCFRRRGYGYR